MLTAARLRLEPFADDHVTELHEMNRDPEVMRYITGKPETFEETQASLGRVKARWAEWGFSWWSFIELATGKIVGAGRMAGPSEMKIFAMLRRPCASQRPMAVFGRRAPVPA